MTLLPFSKRRLMKPVVGPQAVDEPAAAFGAHGTPEALKVVEILGMKRARYTWQVRRSLSFDRFCRADRLAGLYHERVPQGA